MQIHHWHLLKSSVKRRLIYLLPQKKSLDLISDDRKISMILLTERSSFFHREQIIINKVLTAIENDPTIRCLIIFYQKIKTTESTLGFNYDHVMYCCKMFLKDFCTTYSIYVNTISKYLELLTSVGILEWCLLKEQNSKVAFQRC